jgi:ATP phosphoribosyltransferase
LRANGLVEVEKIRDISPHLIVSHAALARRRREIFDLLEVLEEMIAS